MAKGNINVSVENIFPMIKKFLYSDHEIFLRELISNATDATLKLKHLCQIGESKADYGQPYIEVKIDKDKKTITISDQGVGMSAEEVDKYINQIAFSGAEEFLEKYKANQSGIIGHFGLGFYSAFMVSDLVEIITKSHKEEEKAVLWRCDGSPEFTLEEVEKSTRGTDVVLHISQDSEEFLKEDKIRELLLKYNRFMPIPIRFGNDKDNVINETEPAWTKQPSQLIQEDYQKFYHQLYPSLFEDPLFNIHLNIDYPFNLTGILYFPKLGQNINIQKDRIQLYQNQVFVTDNVEGIVPEFLTMLKGVIDSPNIPLNVSRSYLQADGNVKKISGYITKKVADKLSSIFKENRKDFQEKWNDIKIVIEYGMITDDKFYEKAKNFALYPTTDGEFFTLDEIVEKIKPLQKDKDGKIVVLYATDQQEQHSYIGNAKAKGYEVLLLNSPISTHLMQKLEQENKDITFSCVNSDTIENLIKKEDAVLSKLTDKEKETLSEIVKKEVSDNNYTIQVEALDSDAAPFMLTQPEFMRRMKDMQQVGASGAMFGNFPDMFNLVVNGNSPLASKILQEKDENVRKELIGRALTLAKLSQGILKGEELSKFVEKSFKEI